MNWPEGVEKPVEVEEYDQARKSPAKGSGFWDGLEFVDVDVADAALAACGQRIEELEREVGRMRVCGTCEHMGGDYTDECMAGRTVVPDPPHAYRPLRAVWHTDRCHVECFGGESRWELGEELLDG